MYEEQCGEDVVGLRGLIENSLMLSIINFVYSLKVFSRGP